MNAADLMTRDVVTVGPQAPLAEAIRLMLKRRVSGLPVVAEDGRLVGLLTERDLLHRVETGTDAQRMDWLGAILAHGHMAERYIHTHGQRVADVMTRDVSTVSPSTPLDKVVRLMEARRIRRVPVLEGERLAGIVSRSDLVRALSVLLDRDTDPAKGDAEIRDCILAEMARQRWVGGQNIGVSVARGVVKFEGEIYDERLCAALQVIAETIPGVTAVHDDLVVLDPNSVLSYGI